MKLNKAITVIIGAAGSGKTTEAKKIASEHDESKVVWVNGSILSFNRCNEDTELVIIEEFKDANDLELLFGPAIDGIAIEHRGKETFYINPKIVVTCKSDVTIKDLPTHSRAFSRRVNIVDLSPEKIIEFKGTKGEWKANNLMHNWVVCYEKNGDELVLDIRDNKHNAKLIAAAPDLLEALQSMTFIFESLADKLPSRVEDFNCYQDAKQAINKALGL